MLADTVWDTDTKIPRLLSSQTVRLYVTGLNPVGESQPSKMVELAVP